LLRTAFRGALIIFQTAVSVLLLSVTLLALNTYWNEVHLRLTYDEQGGYIYGLHETTPVGRDARLALHLSFLDAVRSDPAIEHAAFTTTTITLIGKLAINAPEGYFLPADHFFQWCRVSPDYFGTVGLRLCGEEISTLETEKARQP
jgi:hypothetical protein